MDIILYAIILMEFLYAVQIFLTNIAETAQLEKERVAEDQLIVDVVGIHVARIQEYVATKFAVVLMNLVAVINAVGSEKLAAIIHAVLTELTIAVAVIAAELGVYVAMVSAVLMAMDV